MDWLCVRWISDFWDLAYVNDNTFYHHGEFEIPPTKL